MRKYGAFEIVHDKKFVTTFSLPQEKFNHATELRKEMGELTHSDGKDSGEGYFAATIPIKKLMHVTHFKYAQNIKAQVDSKGFYTFTPHNKRGKDYYPGSCKPNKDRCRIFDKISNTECVFCEKDQCDCKFTWWGIDVSDWYKQDTVTDDGKFKAAADQGKSGEKDEKSGEDHGKSGEDNGKSGNQDSRDRDGVKSREDGGKSEEDVGKSGEDGGKSGEDHGGKSEFEEVRWKSGADASRKSGEDGQKFGAAVIRLTQKYTYVPDFLLNPPESPYGTQGFSVEFSTLIEHYKISRKGTACFLRVGGTLEYKQEIAYVVIVCMGNELPDFPHINSGTNVIFEHNGLLNDDGEVIDHTKTPEFKIKYLIKSSYANHHQRVFNWQNIVFAFYFPNDGDLKCQRGDVGKIKNIPHSVSLCHLRSCPDYDDSRKDSCSQQLTLCKFEVPPKKNPCRKFFCPNLSHQVHWNEVTTKMNKLATN